MQRPRGLQQGSLGWLQLWGGVGKGAEEAPSSGTGSLDSLHWHNGSPGEGGRLPLARGADTAPRYREAREVKVRGVQTKQLASARFDETIWTHMVRSHRQGPCYCCALRCPGVPSCFLASFHHSSMPAGSRTDQGDGVGSPAPTPLPKTVRAKLDRTSQGSCCRGHPLHHHLTFLLHGTRSNTPALHLTMHASIEPVASGTFHFSRLPWHGLKTEPTKQHARYPSLFSQSMEVQSDLPF
jgi:hypothetical protein